MKIFNATFSNGKVYIQNGTVEVPGVTIMSAGAGNSAGILIMAEGECIYIAQTSSDIADALKILADGFTTLSSDVIQASGGTSDVGGATPTFKTDMQSVSTKLKELAGKLK